MTDYVGLKLGEAKLVCDVLVVWKLDRVSRRLLDGL
jgi:DNA invertase Pin-like site-specific DNA recombinase